MALYDTPEDIAALATLDDEFAQVRLPATRSKVYYSLGVDVDSGHHASSRSSS